MLKCEFFLNIFYHLFCHCRSTLWSLLFNLASISLNFFTKFCNIFISLFLVRNWQTQWTLKHNMKLWNNFQQWSTSPIMTETLWKKGCYHLMQVNWIQNNLACWACGITCYAWIDPHLSATTGMHFYPLIEILLAK